MSVAEDLRSYDSDVPVGWQSVELGDVAAVNPDSLRGSTLADYSFGYIDISQIDGPGQCSGWTELTFGEAPSRARRKVQAHDILVSTVRPYLRSFAQVPKASLPLVASTGFAVVRAKENADQQFLYQHILHGSFIDHLTPRMTGSNYPAVSAGDVEAYPLLLPPLDEQRRIAEVLRSVDESIVSAQNVANQAQAVWDGLTEKLIWDRLSTTPDIAQPLGSALLGTDYGVNAPLRSEQAGFAVLRMGNLQDGWIDPSDLKWGDVAEAEAQTLALDVGDILFNRTNSRDLVGKVALVREPTDFLYASYIVRLRVNQSVAAPYYLFAVMHSRRAQARFKSIATPGVSQSNINPTNLKKQIIPIPSWAEQLDIAGQLQAAEIARRTALEELVTLRQIKSDLMSDLLSGRVRVPA